MSIIEDPAEIAALANEFISSLDNLPQEISHLVKEIEHKDAKVQDIMPKISARETQLRELLQKGGSGPANPSGILSEADRLKAEKLTDKIRQDYRRADEWSAQKESLSLRMWRAVHAHHLRLREEMAKISPAVLANYGGAMAAAPPQIPSLASLPAALAGVRSPAVELDATVAGLNGVGSSLDGMDFAGAGAEGDDGEEKDETLYCFCQRVSFGEMIGCDNAENDPECKEWFHISCVGVTKPLPAKWYCSECAAKIKNKRRRQA
ncbi:uncharacterized protein PFL1_02589 [Pseudozyma flocculosa PF-1]|uniref:Chromatin modification-related protein n=1 Tax=Pseudozyma flocculosa PF-1 TaxID=1277687 RepID=A0A061HH02_9BASI|nr:uncharacterized protein PFL1_02589 [Pseudozyma flocculosa PF-1]EPQ29916.1 hypothetical protein PFL1_02589 [Pseudozyma flocculosa PF-1]